MFGGQANQNIIARLDEVSTVWSKVGTLIQPRYGHAVVFDGTSFIVIGGNGSKNIERCLWKDSSMECTQLGSSTYDYYTYPEVFILPDEFSC